MRKTLLAVILLTFIQPAFSATVSPQTTSTPVKPPKVFYEKGKGTMGLIAGLTLGPFGYGGVCLLSHNRIQRKKAKQGCIIWTVVVLSAAIVCLAVAAGGKGGSGSSKSSKGPDLQGLNFGSGSSTSAKRKPQPGVDDLPIFLQP